MQMRRQAHIDQINARISQGRGDIGGNRDGWIAHGDLGRAGGIKIDQPAHGELIRKRAVSGQMLTPNTRPDDCNPDQLHPSAML
jgi:hypothetical protein